MSDSTCGLLPATPKDKEAWAEYWQPGIEGDLLTRLRLLTTWCEQHGLQQDEFLSVGASRFDTSIHLEERAARRLFPGREVMLTEDGHAYFREDGILFCFIEDAKPQGMRKVTL